ASLGIFMLLAEVAVVGQVTFQAEVNLFSIAARVTDGKGRDIRNLTAADFSVIEDGRPQAVAFFAAEAQPISLAVLIDVSSSMRKSGKYDQAKAALGTLWRASAPGSQFFYGEFSEFLESFAEVDARGQQRVVLAKSRVKGGGTALYDSITLALC